MIYLGILLCLHIITVHVYFWLGLDVPWLWRPDPAHLGKQWPQGSKIECSVTTRLEHCITTTLHLGSFYLTEPVCQGTMKRTNKLVYGQHTAVRHIVFILNNQPLLVYIYKKKNCYFLFLFRTLNCGAYWT